MFFFNNPTDPKNLFNHLYKTVVETFFFWWVDGINFLWWTNRSRCRWKIPNFDQYPRNLQQDPLNGPRNLSISSSNLLRGPLIRSHSNFWWTIGKLPSLKLTTVISSVKFHHRETHLFLTIYRGPHNSIYKYQGTIGCTPNSVPMVFIVFSRDSWGL